MSFARSLLANAIIVSKLKGEVMRQVEYASMCDIPRLCELLKILFGQEREFYYDETVQSRGLAMILSDASIGSIFVIKEERYIVGMVSFLWTVSTALGAKVAWLEDMVIDSPYQNKGYGKMLLGEALDAMKKLTCKRVRLLTDADNAYAQKLYQRFGFDHSSMHSMRLFIS